MTNLKIKGEWNRYCFVASNQKLGDSRIAVLVQMRVKVLVVEAAPRAFQARRAWGFDQVH